MKRTNDDLERKLEKLYTQVPSPPRELASGRERMLIEAARLRETYPVSVGRVARAKKPQQRLTTALVWAYKAVVIVLAAIVGAAGMGGGIALAASGSLPGDVLYPIKLAVEDARLALSADPATRAKLSLTLAAERVGEMQRLSAQGETIPDEALARLAQHTEQAMAQIAQARPERVPVLLERTVQGMLIQKQVLEQAQIADSERARAILRRVLETTQVAYQTASAARGDPKRFREEYQRRHRGSVDPYSAPSPGVTAESKQEQEREGGQSQGGTPSHTPQRNQEQEREGSHTPVPTHTPILTQTPMHTPTPRPTHTPHQRRMQEPTRTPRPTHTPMPTHTPRPTHTSKPTHTLMPTHTPRPTHTSKPEQTPAPRDTPEKGEHRGGGH